MKLEARSIDRACMVFTLIFAYTLGAGLLMQLFVLPVLYPDLHAGHGLLKGGDWVQFHDKAAMLANRILEEGWLAWELRPEGNAPIGIAALCYAVTGISEPWVLMPINAACFALSGFCLYQTFCHFTSPHNAWIALFPYVLFPSAIGIYGQIHKDAWSIAGSLLLLLVLVRFSVAVKPGYRYLLSQIACTLLAVIMVWIVRPYLVKVLLFSSLISVLFMVIVNWRSEPRPASWWAGIIICLGLLVCFTKLTGGESVAQVAVGSSSVSSGSVQMLSYVAQLADARDGFTGSGLHATSNLDTNVRFNSLVDVLKYVPRALQIGLFAPFPSMWGGNGASPGSDKMRLVAGVEMAIAYVMFVGVILYMLSGRGSMLIMVPLAYSTSTLLIQSLVICNVGTLYRMRYGIWQVILGMGIIGWCLFLKNCREPKLENSFRT